MKRRLPISDNGISNLLPTIASNRGSAALIGKAASTQENRLKRWQHHTK
jgi:hypothetical protein